MPYAIQSNGDSTFRVVNTDTGKVHAKRVTKKVAKSQLKLLNAIEHGYDPNPRRDHGNWFEVR